MMPLEPLLQVKLLGLFVDAVIVFD